MFSMLLVPKMDVLRTFKKADEILKQLMWTLYPTCCLMVPRSYEMGGDSVTARCGWSGIIGCAQGYTCQVNVRLLAPLEYIVTTYN